MAFGGRMRFLFRTFKHYRAAKKAGHPHEEALQTAIGAATDQQISDEGVSGEKADFLRAVVPGLASVSHKGRSGDIAESQVGREVARVLAKASGEDTDDWPEFSQTVQDAWIDGEATFRASRHPNAETWAFIGLPFQVEAAHIALLRNMKFAWDGCESGAPMLDPKRPYGERDVIAQLGKVFIGEAEDALALRHIEMSIVLGKALRHGELKPGTYPMRNLTPEALRAQMAGYGDDGLSDETLGLTADGSFTFTHEHAKLMKVASLEWSNRHDNEDRLDAGEYPAAAIDPKRCYGDMSWIEKDMAVALGRLSEQDAYDGDADLPKDLERHLGTLHFQMLGAIQVFVENVNLPPGTYDAATDA